MIEERVGPSTAWPSMKETINFSIFLPYTDLFYIHAYFTIWLLLISGGTECILDYCFTVFLHSSAYVETQTKPLYISHSNWLTSV